MASSDVDWKPMIGMGFDYMEEASKFWLAYSFHVGFGVRVRFTNKKEDGSVSQEEGEEEQICSLLSLSLSRVVLF